VESCDDACLAEIEVRNRLIRELRREIEHIYIAAYHLIQHAQSTPDGSQALSKWDRDRPSPTKGLW